MEEEKRTTNEAGNIILARNHWDVLIVLLNCCAVVASIIAIFFLGGHTLELCKACTGENCKYAIDAWKTLIYCSFGLVGLFVFCNSKSPSAVAESLIKIAAKIRERAGEGCNRAIDAIGPLGR